MDFNRVILLSLLLLSNLTFSSHAAAKTLVVSAAASLKDAFVETGKIFEKDYPGTKIAFNFSSSNQLAGQIEQGAPVDVFASADMSHIRQLIAKNFVAENSVLAKNKLIIIVSKKTTMKIDSIADLSTKGLRLIMASKHIPLAKYASQFLKNVDQTGMYGSDYSSRVLGNAVSEEPDVRMVAMKIALGEGDAGIVYVSDIAGDVKNKVKTIAISDQLNVIAEYGVAIVKSSAQPETARAFYRLLLSPQGQAILAKSGLLSIQTK